MKSQLTILKVGGQIIEEKDSLKTLLKDFSLIAGNKLLVHGGGRAATDLAAKLGVKTQMIDGRRITDEKMLKIATMVYAGLVNKNIVAELQALRMDAIGLTGADLNLILAEKRPVGKVDYGFVGDVKEVNAPVLNDLLNQGYTPVLAPISHDGNGNLLNTNADTIASEVARVLAFDFNVRLIFCFEKRGVLLDENDENSVIQFLDRDLYAQYKEEGRITAGMLPKLDNAFQAIASGVKEVVITSASHINTGGGTFIR
ncbi:MAG: acetylglutamate kinase [Dysgonamonadaceae bacterium]|jgi:acetylglutamate kinase|nr:acetylglutamate kinase [Dysgonamonadaceae bacterium]